MSTVHYTPLDNIVVGDARQRQTISPDAIAELAEDIQKPHGLLQPIILANDSQTLVAGERRLRAISSLAQAGKSITFGGEAVPLGQVPFVRLGDLSEAEVFEAELSENIRRVNLSWQETVSARAKLAKLRRDREPSRPVGEVDTETYAEITRQPVDQTSVGSATKTIREDLLLADNMHRPAVREAKNRTQAIKALMREQEADLAKELIRRHGLSAFRGAHACLHGDLGVILPSLEANRFDAIVCDPPYGINAQSFGEQATVQHTYDDNLTEALRLVSIIASEGFRVCKSGAHMYLFCAFERWSAFWDVVTTKGWRVWPRPIVWFKGAQGHLPRPDHGPRYSCEYIMFASKGDRPVTGVFLDHIDIPAISGPRQHAAQKPVAVIEDLIRRCCRPGDSVLDPTCGSGTIFPAAERQSVGATGIEMDEDMHAIAFNRMRNPNE